MYVKVVGSDIIVVGIYVDDILATGTRKQVVDDFFEDACNGPPLHDYFYTLYSFSFYILYSLILRVIYIFYISSVIPS
jgi:hypothetical protein